MRLSQLLLALVVSMSMVSPAIAGDVYRVDQKQVTTMTIQGATLRSIARTTMWLDIVALDDPTENAARWELRLQRIAFEVKAAGVELAVDSLDDEKGVGALPPLKPLVEQLHPLPLRFTLTPTAEVLGVAGLNEWLEVVDELSPSSSAESSLVPRTAAQWAAVLQLIFPPGFDPSATSMFWPASWSVTMPGSAFTLDGSGRQTSDSASDLALSYAFARRGNPALTILLGSSGLGPPGEFSIREATAEMEAAMTGRRGGRTHRAKASVVLRGELAVPGASRSDGDRSTDRIAVELSIELEGSAE